MSNSFRDTLADLVELWRHRAASPGPHHAVAVDSPVAEAVTRIQSEVWLQASRELQRVLDKDLCYGDDSNRTPDAEEPR